MKYAIETGRTDPLWKPIVKCLAWITAFAAVSLAIIYGFWLVLIFLLFEQAWMWLAIAGEMVLWIVWYLLIRMLDE